MTEIRSAYSKREKVYAQSSGKSMTQQSFKDSCDINNIMAKYQKTGVVDHVAKFQPNYNDCSAMTFTESQQLIANAQNMFNELPSAARKFFQNDPASFLDFVDNLDDETGGEKLYELGLLAEGLTYESPEKEKISEDTTEPTPEEKPTEIAPE